MTGLLRTSLFFFLPIFGALIAYHTWVADPRIEEERQAAFKQKFEAVIQSTADAASGFLAAGEGGRRELPEDVARRGVILAEVVAGDRSILRLTGDVLRDAGPWSMVPDPAVRPAFMPGFRFSFQGGSLQAVLLETTVYGPDGDPALLNVYVREDSFVGYE